MTLIGAYVAGALRQRRRGFIAAASLCVVYSVAYLLVISENYALLMGAMVLFIVLAVLMTATRNVDWYSLAMRRSPDLPIDRTGSS